MAILDGDHRGVILVFILWYILNCSQFLFYTFERSIVSVFGSKNLGLNMPGIFFFLGILHMNYFNPLLEEDTQVEKYPFDVYKYRSAFYNWICFVPYFRLEFQSRSCRKMPNKLSSAQYPCELRFKKVFLKSRINLSLSKTCQLWCISVKVDKHLWNACLWLEVWGMARRE